jgi:hypothetical protein
MKGMLVSVLRSATDCSNGGVTSTHSEFLLVGPGIPEIFEARNLPVLRCEPWYGHYRAVAESKPGWIVENLAGPMFGGNFIWTSDSRFPGKHPIPVHDRFETWTAYNANFDYANFD